MYKVEIQVFDGTECIMADSGELETIPSVGDTVHMSAYGEHAGMDEEFQVSKVIRHYCNSKGEIYDEGKVMIILKK